MTQFVYPLTAGLRRVWQQLSGPVGRWLKTYGRSHRTSRALIWRWLLSLMICIEPKSIWRKDLWSSSGTNILFNLNKMYWIPSVTFESLNIFWFVYFLAFVFGLISVSMWLYPWILIKFCKVTLCVFFCREKDALWQKSDALEFEQKLRDEETERDVNYCLGCHTLFSFWLRKYNCRSHISPRNKNIEFCQADLLNLVMLLNFKRL